LILILLGQCISYKERTIFDYLLIIFKDLDYQNIGYHLFNLAIQCLLNQWYECSIDLLQMQSNMKNNLHEKHWILFFRHLFNNNQSNLIEILMKLMIQKQLTPLDVILRVCYTNTNEDYCLALNYLEQGEKLHHPLRINYFYPLLINAYSFQTSQNWSDDNRLRLYRLLNHFSIPIDSLTYSNLFHQYYQNDYRSLLNLLSRNHLQSILDRVCRLLLHDVRQQILPLNIIEQIAPYFRLHNHTRQEELARSLLSV
jgi:hypothetical protein